jgi:tetratricopeptide (TPR) repeat protein
MVYKNISEYSKALLYHEKALEILQKTLPANHPNLAAFYKNIAVIYDSIKEYPKALSYLQRAQNIFQISLPPNHPHAQGVRQSIELIKKKL